MVVAEMAEQLADVPGVVGVVLGGSRARGDHRPDSDYDVGIYYRGELGVDLLSELAKRFGGPDAKVTRSGGWGPWVDGGGWLVVDGTAVDWIYRDVDRVQDAWSKAERGEYAFHRQPGHPLGFPDFAYAGEIALAKVLSDPSGELTQLHDWTHTYPDALRHALEAALWEAHFSIAGAAKVTSRGDAAYVAGCLFRALLLCAHALHAHDRVWLINEKGAIDAAGRLPSAPPGFAERARDVLGRVGTTGAEIAVTLDAARALVTDVAKIVGGPTAG